MNIKKKLLLVAGARPNFMKIAPLLRELDRNKQFNPILVHTGQHYDYGMSESFFKDLEIRRPDYFLNVGSGTHAQQTAKTMFRFERVCVKERPLLVIVVGDVNSSLACAITAKKLNIKLAHVEAGLRSFDMAMPEEINRVVTDSVSDFLFVTEPSGIDNLRREGRGKNKIFFVGNTMIDSLIFGLNKLNKLDYKKFSMHSIKNKFKYYGIVTLHRPSNVDDRSRLLRIINTLNKIASRVPLIFPIHPRTEKNINYFKVKCSSGIYIVKPQGYLDFLFLCKDAKLVLTDSGGLQEETTFLKIPCLTLRDNTERPITVSGGTNTIVGNEPKKIISEVGKIIDGTYKLSKIPELWDGRASQRITDVLIKHIKW